MRPCSEAASLARVVVASCASAGKALTLCPGTLVHCCERTVLGASGQAREEDAASVYVYIIGTL